MSTLRLRDLSFPVIPVFFTARYFYRRPHALVAPIQAVTMAMSVTIGTGYVISCSYFKAHISLLDVWIGLVLMQGSRAITFSFRHWFDRRGPLALKLALAKESEDSEEKEGEGAKNNGEDA